MKFVLTCYLSLGILLFGLSGSADAMRCGNELVQRNDPRVVVLGKCGEPDDIAVSTRERRVGSVTITTIVEMWTYNFGPNEFIHYLTFEDGRLISIRTGRFGF